MLSIYSIISIHLCIIYLLVFLVYIYCIYTSYMYYYYLLLFFVCFSIDWTNRHFKGLPQPLTPTRNTRNWTQLDRPYFWNERRHTFYSYPDGNWAFVHRLKRKLTLFHFAVFSIYIQISCIFLFVLTCLIYSRTFITVFLAFPFACLTFETTVKWHITVRTLIFKSFVRVLFNKGAF